MKKTLLIAAAALAAGVITSQAQVYSQNIVGYVNQPVPANYTLMAVQLNVAGGNSLTNLIQNPGGIYDGSGVFVWNGTGYTQYTIDSGFATGVGDAADAVAVDGPNLPPGPALLFNNQGASNTVTIAGSVAVNALPGTTTNTIPGNKVLTLTASILPVGGGISSALGFQNVGGALDGNYIYIPKFNAAHVQTGFNQYTFDSGFASGFGDAADSVQVSEPQIPVGSGFFYGNQDGTTRVWVQTLTP